MSTRRRGRAPLRCSADDGITLVELLVAMVIMSMVVLATVTLTVGMQRTDSGTWGRTDDTTAAQYAMRVISRSVPYALHPAPFADAIESPVLVAEQSRLAVVIQDPHRSAGPTAGVGTATEALLLVEFEVAGGALTERRTSLDGIDDGAELLALLPLSSGCTLRDCETRVLADGVQTGTGFRYLDADGAVTTAAVRSVDVTLVVLTAPERQSVASTHRQRIHLKND
jgi:type II secretory pathway component PulJ